MIFVKTISIRLPFLIVQTKNEMSMEYVLKCGKPCNSDDSIEKITDDKWSNAKSNAEQWKGLDKFGDVWDTTNWEDGQQGRYMHNNCYITLCSSNKREQAIIRDGKKREAAKDMLVSTSHSHDKSDLLPTYPKQKKNSVIHRRNSKEGSMCMVHEKGG